MANAAIRQLPAMGEKPAASDKILMLDGSTNRKKTVTYGNLSEKVSQELTVTGDVTTRVESVELNHATVVVEATIADAANHAGLFVVKDTSATGVVEHTLTLTAGTFNGTNNVATFNALNECLVVYFDSAGNGTVVENVGSVALS